MKRIAFAAIGALLPAASLAQPAGGFRHIVIVVQENRTPDNIFGSNPTFEPGVDIATAGLNSLGQTVPLTPVPLNSCYDVLHKHGEFERMYDNGRMDGANLEALTLNRNCTRPANGQYKYIDNSTGTVQPYFDIAAQYGFANRMFQTNQGPSFPAHQFLFGGSSAPTELSNEFIGDDLLGKGLGAGCTAGSTQRTPLVGAHGYTGKSVFPCMTRQSMAGLLDAAGVSWIYYNSATDPTTGDKSVWEAPDALSTICEANGQGPTAACVGPVYTAHVAHGQAQVLRDIKNCALPQVSWVIPNGWDSDHAQSTGVTGPSWVASVVNEIGEQATCNNGEKYWDDTAVLITWDDWGGWYDHVPPFLPNGQPNGWGAGYTYGFRVPLLVVSAYTPAGYVDNTNYDFGSLLAFVESNFGLGRIGGGNFADAYANDLTAFFTLATPRTYKPIASPYGPHYFINAHRSSVPVDTD